jgi:hypothetical protein
MPNTNVLNPIADMYQTQLEVTRQFADTLFSGTEKIDHVIINATHRALTEQLRLAQALAAVRDPRGLASLQSMLVPHPENAANCQREVLQVFAEMQAEIGKSMQQFIEQLGSNAANSTAKRLGVAREQLNGAPFDPITGMLSVWESAFREATAFTNKNIIAAAATMEDAANAAATVAYPETDSTNIVDHEDATEGSKRTARTRTTRTPRTTGSRRQ